MLGDGWTGWYPLDCMTTKALAVLVMKNRECHWANQYHDHECVWVCVFGLKNDSTLDIILKWIVLLPDIFSYSCIHSWKAWTPYWSPIYIFSWTKWFVRFFAHQVLTDWVWEEGGYWFVRFFAHRWSSLDRLSLRRGRRDIVQPAESKHWSSLNQWMIGSNNWQIGIM